MADEVVDYLVAHGPRLSGDVAGAIVETMGISPHAARKRIERLLRSESIRTVNLTFPRRAQFLYVPAQYGSPRFWRNLATALEESKGAYARAIWALRARGGVIPLTHFDSAAGASSGSRQLSGESVCERLVSVGLFQEIDVPGLGPCVAFAKGNSFIDDLVPEVRARLVAETVLLQSVQEWAAKLGLGSFHTFKLRRDEPGVTPTVGSFEWDLSAPSFVGPLATWSETGKPKPGFLVVDVLLKDKVDVEDVRPFVYKCTSLRQQRGVGRCLQFFVAHRYTKQALNTIRREGIVPATPESLFGTEVARALMELASTLTHAATQCVEPEKFARLFERLGKAEGAAGTLRGALFEFVVADLIRHTVANADITMNKIYRSHGKDAAEVDVRFATKDQHICFIECKGLLPGRVLSDKDVDDWLTRRIPIVRAHTLDNHEWRNHKLKFEMWLTGELSPEAKVKIEAARAEVSSRRYTIEVRYAQDIEQLAAPFPALHKVVTQHFLKHPLSSPVDVINPLSKRQHPRALAVFDSLSPEVVDEL
ncbi:hypothetical protein [Burkholderia pseudomallei]|uniref:hypothetical protein n=1 Tax=Burkholderia pseudomallei TaxID=28450 RepID=UPI000F0531BC|nr:hypothetical protein [Burkholderia pseudomallei]CAJ3552502.1 Uncharacterised protein [Burkholderia pseudomallei]CAJ5966769.1 Uncharacterised protein [Burkholderia pseudomallei]CAJ7415842.1 Uncharacterised protein [Burkholderia pseudomallei]CAJ9261318.1 Uncharacterised protein [Burkholderia pseudomallei]VBL26283.1 Uncharacterised protein [Burkholderia pseudomallei]